MNRNVLITGASRGLGRMLAQCFSDFGDNLILNSRSEFDLLGFHKFPNVVLGDITEQVTTDKLCEVVKRLGSLDILVNNAAIRTGKPFTDCSMEQILYEIKVNLIAPIHLTRLFWNVFVKQQSGVIVNINSITGKGLSRDDEVIYRMTKQALQSFSEGLRYSAISNGIKLIDVFLGAMKTEMCKDAPDYTNFMDPWDVSQVILDICSNKFHYSTVSQVEIRRTKYGKKN